MNAAKLAAVLCAAMAVSIGGPALADDEETPPWWDRATFSFVWENDIYAGSDDNYTNGVEFSFVSDENRDLPLGRRFRLLLPDYFDRAESYRTALGIGQMMFTPEDISLPNPDPNDRPYAGFTYLNVSLLTRRNEHTLHSASLQVGIVGPASGAEWVQTNWHRIIDAEDPKGWPHQLNNELGVVLRLDRTRRSNIYEIGQLDLGAEVNWGGAIGNVETSANAGVTVRLGERFLDDYGVPRIRPAFGSPAVNASGDTFSWYVFAGANVRAVARNIFLDGNTFSSSAEVDDRRPLVVDFQGGLALTIGSVCQCRLAFTYVTRSEEFPFQDGATRFGAATISRRF